MTETTRQSRHPAADTQEGQAIVYIRAADRETLPDELRGYAGTPYAIHDASGARVGLAPDRRQAFALARRHDLIPVSVH